MTGKVIVMGAGPTGLSAAFHLGPQALLVERESRVGGACRSVYRDGFTFDLAGQIMASDDAYVHELYTLLLRDNVHWQECPAGSGEPLRFGYPLRGGFQALMNAFLPYIQGKIRLETTVTEISPLRREVRFQDGTLAPYDVLLSTAPLPRLIEMMGSEAPATVRDAAAGLKHVSVRCVHLGVGRESLTGEHWIHASQDCVFHRVFAQGNTSPHCNAPGGFGLTCEITYSAAKPLPELGDALIHRCVEDCRRAGILAPDDPVWTAFQTDLPYAYVVNDAQRQGRVERVRAWLQGHDILLAGRFGEWENYDPDRAFIAGRDAAFAADAIIARNQEVLHPTVAPAPMFGFQGLYPAR